MLRTAEEILIEMATPYLLKEGTIKDKSEAKEFFDTSFQNTDDFMQCIFGAINQGRKEALKEAGLCIITDGNPMVAREKILDLIDELK